MKVRLDFTDCDSRIGAIRVYRFLTKAGLKEAKEYVERFEGGLSDVIVTHMDNYQKALEEIRQDYGIKMMLLENTILTDLRELTKRSLDENEFDIARALLEVLEKEVN